MSSALPEPAELQGRLDREEFTQKLLTCLILGRVEQRWNVRRVPSPAGALFVRHLHRSAFGDGSVPDDAPSFVDEFELPKRVEAEPSGWPDYGVVWPSRLFLVELRTDRAGHRAEQIPHYLHLADHWHSEIDVDLLYLTPAMPLARPDVVSTRQRFSHLTWAEVAPLVESTWSHSDVPAEREYASYLVDLINDIETAVALRAPAAPQTITSASPEGRVAASLPAARPEDVDRALALAAETETDGVQRVLETEVGDPADLDALRLQVRDRLVRGPTVNGVEVRQVLPWMWRAATSGGQALTEGGEATGYELRLSRYEETRPWNES